jgi:hypothetical protein
MIPLSLGVVLRMLRVHVFEFIGQIWRPVVSAAVMYLCVHEFLRLAHDGAALPYFLASVALGVAVYLASVSALWLMCRRPAGAEQIAVVRTTEIVGRFLSRKPALPQ